jgi:hypothetical protein
MRRINSALLKFAFLPPAEIERNGRLWRLGSIEARSELADLLAENPGLRPSIGELFEAGWRMGRLQALKAIEVPDEAIPKTPLWSFDQAIDENFIPSK